MASSEVGFVKRLPYPRSIGISISKQSGIQLHGFTLINTILLGCKILLATSLKQIGTSTTLLATPYTMLGTPTQRLVSRNSRNLTETKCEEPGSPTDLLWMKTYT